MSPPALRCAIYTRKSSEEGLEQSFNSLDAQREACEAYIKSQAHEGWRMLAARYDDGGFSGGTLERPGLRRLLADIDAGRIDTVVVYKVDRLTRALSDFAKIVERMDARGVSFVSVTQAFNTTTSMGRLTLNVLLSFAQFEREVTGERIRDKIAASKAKGMWMGGTTPLGYDAKDRTLVVNPADAATVRVVFDRYLAIGSVHRLRDELEHAAVRSKGGAVLSRGALFHLLRNRIYLGQIVHKDKVHPGLHPPIVDEALFARVQAMLDANVVARTKPAKATSASPLTGLIFDSGGAPMCPSFSLGKGGRAYRYYVSSAVITGRFAEDDDAIRRVPAPATEAFVLGRLQRHDPAVAGLGELAARTQRVCLRAGSVRLQIKFRHDQVRDRHDRNVILARADANDEVRFDGDVLHLTAPLRMQFRGGRTWLAGPDERRAAARIDPVLVGGLKRAHALLAKLGAAPHSKPAQLQDARGPGDPYLRNLYPIAMLAPDIQRAVLAGRQPAGLTLQHLLDSRIPVSWHEQRAMLGFPDA
ncbi:MAG TPA: recombinase family protein [Caulobacteraceae bacterium]|nr:recombinase family protein [Caulobacteraceae bacterium]